MKDTILKAMDDMLQKNVTCQYLIKFENTSISLHETPAIDAYMRAYEISKQLGVNVACYMVPLDKPAVSPVFKIENGTIVMSGQQIIDENTIENFNRSNLEMIKHIYNFYTQYRKTRKYDFVFYA